MRIRTRSTKMWPCPFPALLPNDSSLQNCWSTTLHLIFYSYCCKIMWIFAKPDCTSQECHLCFFIVPFPYKIPYSLVVIHSDLSNNSNFFFSISPERKQNYPILQHLSLLLLYKIWCSQKLYKKMTILFFFSNYNLHVWTSCPTNKPIYILLKYNKYHFCFKCSLKGSQLARNWNFISNRFAKLNICLSKPPPPKKVQVSILLFE